MYKSKQFLLLVIMFGTLPAHATFSIVAYDPVTGEIGSAGASCVSGQGNVRILSDIILGTGVIHTQAFYEPGNQTNAYNRMVMGDTPSEIIAWLVENDIQGNPSVRQYLALNSDGVSAGYTGNNPQLDVGLDVNGLNYAVAGNILLESSVVTDMEAAFEQTQGTLAERLMASLQAAKRVGADSRCEPFNISSAGAFLRVATLCDTDSSAGQLGTDLEVFLDGSSIFEPIDALQDEFDQHTAPACVIDLIFADDFEGSELP